MSDDQEGLPHHLAEFQSNGWAIFPVRGKVPLTPNGFKDASTDANRWSRWLVQYPGCGWAAPSGERNGFDVLDADTLEAVADLEGRLPPGPRVRTGGGGMHFYLRHSAGSRNWAKRLPGVDFRGEGGYVVLAGSTHDSGRRYEWVGGTESLDLPDSPAWLIALHGSGAERAASGARFLEGERNDRLFRIASAVRAKGGDVLHELRAANAERCSPPLPDSEVVRIAASASRYPVRAGTDEPETANGLFVVVHHERSGAPDELRPVRAAFEAALTAKWKFACPRDSQELLVCREGVYVHAESYVAAWIQAEFQRVGETANARFVVEVLCALRRSSFREPDVFDPPHLLPLSNGYLDVRTRRFQPYDDSGEPLFTTRLDVGFDETAQCPEFIRVVARLFPRFAERIAFQQYCGYILDPSQQFKVGCVVLGLPNIGKTAVLEGVQEALGDRATAAIGLGELCSSRFSAWPLIGKIASIAPDLPYAPVEHTGLYKQITGGDHVNVEPKGGRPYRARLRVKFLFGANVLPRITTTDASVFGRFLVLVSTAAPLPATGRDRDLGAKLEAESAGILQWMIRGFELLRLSDGFNRELLDQSEQLWMQSSDPVRAFVDTCLTASPAARTKRAEVLAALDEWVEANALSLFDRDPAKSVAALIRRRFPSIQEHKDSHGRWWLGIEVVLPGSGTNGRKPKLGGPGDKQQLIDAPVSSPGSTEVRFPATAAATAAEPGTWMELGDGGVHLEPSAGESK